MEHFNIETQFKQKLSNREIAPSDLAWDKLNAMLTVAEKPKKKFGWLYIAASFVGFLLIGTVFFSTTQDVSDQPLTKKIVFENENKNSKQKTILNNKVSNTNLVIVKEKENRKNKIEKIKSESINPTIINQKNELVLVINSNQNNEAEILVKSTKIEQLKYIDAKALLADVENNEAAKKQNLVLKNNNLKLDPKQLLTNVDSELELSFREKVVKKINKNYQSIKTVVLERNVESRIKSQE